MMDIFGKKKIAELSAALANEQAKSSAQEKKTRTAAIIGGSTTAATAAAAVAVHFVFGSGKKINKQKLAKYDQVVEERDRVIDENSSLKTALAGEQSLKALAIGDADNLANAINSRDPEYMVKANNDHKRFRKEIYGDATEESLRNSMALFDQYIAALEKAAPATPAATITTATNATPAATITAATNATPAVTNAENEELKAAKAAFDTACQKANELKTSYETARDAYDKIVNDATKQPDEKAVAKKTMDDAKTALDAAEANLKKAEDDLKALQAQQK